MRKETGVARFEVLILAFVWWKWVKPGKLSWHRPKCRHLYPDLQGTQCDFYPLCASSIQICTQKFWCFLNRWIYVCVWVQNNEHYTEPITEASAWCICYNLYQMVYGNDIDEEIIWRLCTVRTWFQHAVSIIGLQKKCNHSEAMNWHMNTKP
jgi:hypothetical protein